MKAPSSAQVFVAHAWCPKEFEKVTVGPWHWWGIYQTEAGAKSQAFLVAQGWGGHGLWEIWEEGEPEKF